MRTLLLFLLATGCNETNNNNTTATCTAVARTCNDVIATFSTGFVDVTVTCDATSGIVTMESSGLPNYVSNQSTPNAIGDQMWVMTFPLNPTCADSSTNVKNSRGPIGFMVNGVPFYGPEDANGNDAVINEGPTFDDCQGHADMMCRYHYHEEPLCVFGKTTPISSKAGSDGHAAVIGYALDGFAIHGADSAAKLDECNGHVDATRGYHYHASAGHPYLIACQRGKPTGTMRGNGACP